MVTGAAGNRVVSCEPGRDGIGPRGVPTIQGVLVLRFLVNSIPWIDRLIWFDRQLRHRFKFQPFISLGVTHYVLCTLYCCSCCLLSAYLLYSSAFLRVVARHCGCTGIYCCTCVYTMYARAVRVRAFLCLSVQTADQDIQ